MGIVYTYVIRCKMAGHNLLDDKDYADIHHKVKSAVQNLNFGYEICKI